MLIKYTNDKNREQFKKKMSWNLREQVKGCQNVRIRHSHKTGAVTVAQRHNWGLCCDALQGAEGQVVQAG